MFLRAFLNCGHLHLSQGVSVGCCEIGCQYQRVRGKNNWKDISPSDVLCVDSVKIYSRH